MKRKPSAPTSTTTLPKPSRKLISRTATIEITEVHDEKHSVNIDFKDSQVRNSGARVFDAICHMIKGNIEDMCSDLGKSLGSRLKKNEQKKNEVDALIIQHTLLKASHKNLLEEIRTLTTALNPASTQEKDKAIHQLKTTKRTLINLITKHS